jgi:cellobiose phosphorylase
MTPSAIASESGLRVLLNANGSLRRMERGDTLLNLFPGNELEGGPANLYLRRHTARRIEWVPLLGPGSPAQMCSGADGFCARGEWQALRFRAALRLARSSAAWFWHVELENAGAEPASFDLIYAQDLALADRGAVRNNEFYVSQYVDHTPLVHAQHGVALAVRQNLPMGGRQPWALIGSLGRATSFATDALQFHGIAHRSGAGPAALAGAELPGRRLQHEHSLAVLQDEIVRLEPGASSARGFFGWFEPHHAEASGPADLAFVERALALPEARPGASGEMDAPGEPPAASLFRAPPLAALDLDEDELAALCGPARREIERDAGGRMLSCFTGPDRHVVLRAKELAVLRPHGQILRSGASLVPDEQSLTTTVWMAGGFHSMLTQGHVSINRLLSSAHGYLGLFRAHGLRVFAEQDGRWQLLDLPSACEMGPSRCRWLYKHAGGLIEVMSTAPVDHHALELELRVLAGAPCRFLVSNQLAIDGDDGAEGGPPRWSRDARGVAVGFRPDSDLGRRFPDGCFRIDPECDADLVRIGGDELLFVDGRARGQPFLVLETAGVRAFGLRITGPLGSDAEFPRSEGLRPERFWLEASGGLALRGPSGAAGAEVARIQEILPWFAHDALIHYLAPRGLEQYNGGGWGTRDVAQGPVELLLALGRFRELRDLLLRLFRNQNPDGDWPQWFMFFEREREIRAPDSHGDIVFWPLLALAEYLLASDDAALLDEPLPFFDPRGDAVAARAPLWSHVERALDVIAKRVIPGTALAAFGNGDWDDSLQPVDPSMCERLCSSWTVGLHYQTLQALARALRRVGRPERAPALEAAAARVREDSERLLIPGGVLAGFAYFHPDGRMDPLLHPDDRNTGIGFRLLPMMHAITSDLFTREQADAHVGYIRQHLLAPDGVRLFDRPHRYSGGPQRWFRRAESAAYFGREIGLMYMHAQLRFAEAMARYGDGEAFFGALLRVNPIGLRALIPSARLRQANCYHTSSDAAFADRYEAQSRYDEVRRGTVPLEGGWRVYSSGPGVALRLVHHHLAGVRRGRSRLLIDPVLPRALDGLRARLPIAGRDVEVEYRIRERGHGPTRLRLNGRELEFTREPNPYRSGGAEVALDALGELLGAGTNCLCVELE